MVSLSTLCENRSSYFHNNLKMLSVYHNLTHHVTLRICGTFRPFMVKRLAGNIFRIVIPLKLLKRKFKAKSDFHDKIQ